MELNIYTIYLIGLVFWTWFYYMGAKRGGARSPEISALLFASLWFVTMWIFVYQLIMSFRKN